MSHVEVLVTGIKIESSNQRPFWGLIKESRIAKINRSRTHGCNLTFDPLKIKCSRASEGNNQAIFGDQKLDPGCIHLNKLVSSPDPPRPRPVGKLEREKRKEGLVNRQTTTCSSAGMLAELIKTSLSKLIAYLWETVRNSGHVQR